ncbi:MAG: DUF6273 domain-containing protein [Clostridiales bacterium]|nr:DUF6273 domain-containing protein [Clostridiales bacterium]
MSDETYNLPRDSTLKGMAEVQQSLLETQQQIAAAQLITNNHLATIAAGSMATITADFATIRRIVRQGLAASAFTIGDKITVNWTDSVAGKTYEWPFDVVHFGDVELEDGETVPGMFLQAHYCSPFGVQFDQSEALYYCDEALPAGTYHFTIGTKWGTYCVADTSYYFTTTVDIPAGGQIRIGLTSENSAWGAPDNAPGNWRVWTYSSPSSTSCLEGDGLTLTEGTEGTDLGTTTSAIDYSDSGINNLQRAAYGYNRWSQSGIRQYLNSTAAIGSWWTPQNNFDRAPSQLGTYPGFMSGFDSDFLNVLGKVKVTTALNTVSDDQIGTSEDTYDTFFLPSLEQQYITPQLSGVEGDYWEYWKLAAGASSPVAQYVTGAFPVTYAINAQTSAQSVRLRSANRGYANYVWNVTSTGSVYCYYASTANRFAPACVIC